MAVATAWAARTSDLPAFVVMVSQGTGNPNDQPLYDRLWGSGFLPSQIPGRQVPLRRRPGALPVEPAGHRRRPARRMLDDLAELNQLKLDEVGDPGDRHAHRAIRDGLPDADVGARADRHLAASRSTSSTCTAPTSRKPGTFAANCLLARRLAERGVRFIQLFHRGWDQHTQPARRRSPASAATPTSRRPRLVMDLKQRGLLDDTLVVWGGEFGRTVYCQGKLTADDYGRDHHPRCFTIWMAGGGIKPGITHGETDDFCYNIVRDPVHVHDLHATILHCLGIDHTRLTFQFQGRHHRLTDVHGNVVKPVLS